VVGEQHGVTVVEEGGEGVFLTREQRTDPAPQPNDNPEGSNRLPIIARNIEMAFGHFKRTRQEAFGHLVKVGELLIEAKQIIRYGRWGQWLEDNCQFSERTAENYMKIADAVSDGFDSPEKFAELGLVKFLEEYRHDRFRRRQTRGGGKPSKPSRRPERSSRRITKPRFRNNSAGQIEFRWLKRNQVYRAEWESERLCSKCFVYVWIREDNLGFNLLHLRHETDGDKIFGTTTIDQYEHASEVEHWLQSTVPELDSCGQTDIPRMTVEIWEADPITLQVLNEWHYHHSVSDLEPARRSAEETEPTDTDETLVTASME
jgi:hypothetical protein